ncbi:hypothetical protein [Saccharopolyspora taberi]
MDGLMFDAITRPGERELDEDHLRATVRALLEATVSTSAREPGRSRTRPA